MTRTISKKWDYHSVQCEGWLCDDIIYHINKNTFHFWEWSVALLINYYQLLWDIWHKYTGSLLPWFNTKELLKWYTYFMSRSGLLAELLNLTPAKVISIRSMITYSWKHYNTLIAGLCPRIPCRRDFNLQHILKDCRKVSPVTFMKVSCLSYSNCKHRMSF